MARKSLLDSIKLTLDYDLENNKLILVRGNSENQISRIKPRNRKKGIFGRSYCPRQAYNLAISLSLSIEKGEYDGEFEITSQALEKIRAYETDNKPHFEVCIECGLKKYYSRMRENLFIKN